MGTKKLVILISVICALLLGVIGSIVGYIIYNSTDNETEQISPEESEEVSDGPITYEEAASKYSNKEYAKELEKSEYELIFSEEFPIVTVEREVDWESDIPPYIQEYVPVSTQLYETMLSTVEKIQSEQNYSADLWSVSGESRTNFKSEINYRVELSTEIHYYKFVAGVDSENTEDCCQVQVFRRVEIPEVE